MNISYYVNFCRHIDHIFSSLRCQNKLAAVTGGHWKIFTGFIDIFYIPRLYAEEFVLLLEPFIKNEVHVDLAYATVLECIIPSNNFVFINGKSSTCFMCCLSINMFWEHNYTFSIFIS